MIEKTQFEKNGFHSCKLREILNSALFNIPNFDAEIWAAAQISASKLIFCKRQFYPRRKFTENLFWNVFLTRQQTTPE